MFTMRVRHLALLGLGAVAGLAGTSAPAKAAFMTQSFNCDRASECSNAFFPLELDGTFEKVFGYTVRAGNVGSEREYAIEGPNDAPISPQGQATQPAWSSGPSDHSFSFSYTGSLQTATLELSDPPSGITFDTGPVSTTSLPPAATAGINALAIRASTDADGLGRAASLSNLKLDLGGFAPYGLADLVGDGDAEYTLITFNRTISLFTLLGDAQFNPNGALRSTVAYQLKVGRYTEPVTEVPVPATLGLLGLGLLGLGASACATRRR